MFICTIIILSPRAPAAAIGTRTERRNMDLRHSNHTVSGLQYHIVFSPKYRKALLVNGVDIRLKEIIFGLGKEKRWDIQSLEVMPDHVHLLMAANPKWSVSRIVQFIKGRSSRLLRQEFPRLKEIIKTKLWTHSYFVCSVGGSNEEVVKKYIAAQKREILP